MLNSKLSGANTIVSDELAEIANVLKDKADDLKHQESRLLQREYEFQHQKKQFIDYLANEAKIICEDYLNHITDHGQVIYERLNQSSIRAKQAILRSQQQNEARSRHNRILENKYHQIEEENDRLKARTLAAENTIRLLKTSVQKWKNEHQETLLSKNLLETELHEALTETSTLKNELERVNTLIQNPPSPSARKNSIKLRIQKQLIAFIPSTRDSFPNPPAPPLSMPRVDGSTSTKLICLKPALAEDSIQVPTASSRASSSREMNNGHSHLNIPKSNDTCSVNPQDSGRRVVDAEENPSSRRTSPTQISLRKSQGDDSCERQELPADKEEGQLLALVSHMEEKEIEVKERSQDKEVISSKKEIKEYKEMSVQVGDPLEGSELKKQPLINDGMTEEHSLSRKVQLPSLCKDEKSPLAGERRDLSIIANVICRSPSVCFTEDDRIDSMNKSNWNDHVSIGTGLHQYTAALDENKNINIVINNYLASNEIQNLGNEGPHSPSSRFSSPAKVKLEHSPQWNKPTEDRSPTQSARPVIENGNHTLFPDISPMQSHMMPHLSSSLHKKEASGLEVAEAPPGQDYEESDSVAKLLAQLKSLEEFAFSNKPGNYKSAYPNVYSSAASEKSTESKPIALAQLNKSIPVVTYEDTSVIDSRRNRLMEDKLLQSKGTVDTLDAMISGERKESVRTNPLAESVKSLASRQEKQNVPSITQMPKDKIDIADIMKPIRERKNNTTGAGPLPVMESYKQIIPGPLETEEKLPTSESNPNDYGSVFKYYKVRWDELHKKKGGSTISTQDKVEEEEPTEYKKLSIGDVDSLLEKLKRKPAAPGSTNILVKESKQSLSPVDMNPAEEGKSAENTDAKSNSKSAVNSLTFHLARERLMKLKHADQNLHHSSQ